MSTIMRKMNVISRCEAIYRTQQLVYPTQKMMDVHPEVVRITREWNALVSRDITEAEMELFHEILQKLLDKSREIVYGGESAK